SMTGGVPVSESHPEQRAGARRHVSPAPAPRSARHQLGEWWRASRRLAVPLSIVAAMLVVGASATREPQLADANESLEKELQRTRSALMARQGELELARLELNRLSSIVEQSAT